MTAQEILPHPGRPAVAVPIKSHYFSRDLSWLDFNARVLEEAADPRHPLLERVKFLAIFSSNLDEFFMIRVSGVKRQISAGVKLPSIDGLTPTEELAAIRARLDPLLEAQRRLLLTDLIPKLSAAGIEIVMHYSELDEDQRAFLADYFDREVFPVLTPLASDPSHPFPHISNLSLNLAVILQDPENGELFARVKVPATLPRLLSVPCRANNGTDTPVPPQRSCFVWLEQVILANLGKLFPGMQISEAYTFRVTRNADIEIEEDEADDLLRTIEEGVKERRFGAVVRLQLQAGTPAHIAELLTRRLNLTPPDVYTMRGPLGISSLMALWSLDRPDLKDPPFHPVVPPELRRERQDLFAAIRHNDILLHHPYDSFTPLVDLIEAAADDPRVLAIKQTLYRVGANSPIVRALIRAREEDKQVTVLVELKARFDEENNIIWARAMERAGVHVVYGVAGLKTHAKLALIVRRDEDGIRRYVHLGTGNYNASTARIYTDLGLLTCRPEIAQDVSELFNVLTGYSKQRHYRRLLVAPRELRHQFAQMIIRETAHARSGLPARLVFKMNSITDREIIDLLYEASRAGVSVDLIVRGVCCLRPGVPDLSEHIRVRSIVGRFLEHHRIYYFLNGGDEQVYLGSADLMERNLDRRVEALFPVDDPRLARYVYDRLLATYLADNVRARVLQPEGHYVRVQPAEGESLVDSQLALARSEYA